MCCGNPLPLPLSRHVGGQQRESFDTLVVGPPAPPQPMFTIVEIAKSCRRVFQSFLTMKLPPHTHSSPAMKRCPPSGKKKTIFDGSCCVKHLVFVSFVCEQLCECMEGDFVLRKQLSKKSRAKEARVENHSVSFQNFHETVENHAATIGRGENADDLWNLAKRSDQHTDSREASGDSELPPLIQVTSGHSGFGEQMKNKRGLNLEFAAKTSSESQSR